MKIAAASLMILAAVSQAQAQAPGPRRCEMFKGPVAIVCHDRSIAATAFERYGFDAAALASPHMRDFLQRLGCASIDIDAANQLAWSSEKRYDQRTVRESGPITVGFVKKLPADPNVSAWAIAAPYLRDECRTR